MVGSPRVMIEGEGREDAPSSSFLFDGVWGEITDREGRERRGGWGRLTYGRMDLQGRKKKKGEEKEEGKVVSERYGRKGKEEEEEGFPYSLLGIVRKKERRGVKRERRKANRLGNTFFNMNARQQRTLWTWHVYFLSSELPFIQNMSCHFETL